MKTKKWLWIGAVVLVLVGCGFLTFSYYGKGQTTAMKDSKIDYYYCPMHPWIHLEKPGTCSICGMTLVPRLKGQSSTVMSMPSTIQGLASIDLTPWRQQLIGVKLATAEERPIVRRIVTVGRFAGGSNDFAVMAGDFNSKGKTSKSHGSYLVADVYALDIPLIKVGQKVWVSSFSGSGPKVEGEVAHIYPNDGTQSRVGQVRIKLNASMAGELFANVEIEAMTSPRLSVPADSVLDSGLHAYVYSQGEAGHFTPQLVMVGFKGEDYWEITSGLKAGDQIVSGANFLVDADAKLEASFANPDGSK
jgi:hypothetical protein